jgi:hypothetical protein
MAFVIENIRLKELKAVVDGNHDFFVEFVEFVQAQGYCTIREFVEEEDDSKALTVIRTFLDGTGGAPLYDGIFRPFAEQKARWYFLSWLFRDAPAQRLSPLVKSVPGETTLARKSNLLNVIRKHVAPLFPEDECWEWPALSEVLLSRLEGSRRALKGTLFEGIVRRLLAETFDTFNINLQVGVGEKRIEDETYDVQIVGSKKTILMPVKTRETMGGGHSMLFTRDIHKSISVASGANYICVPIVIAESWGGKLDELECDKFVYIQRNPNELKEIEPLLRAEFEAMTHLFKAIE